MWNERKLGEMRHSNPYGHGLALLDVARRCEDEELVAEVTRQIGRFAGFKFAQWRENGYAETHGRREPSAMGDPSLSTNTEKRL